MSEQSYTIHEPYKVKRYLIERADELVFVADGFSFWAMLAAPFWMVYHRMWVALIGFVVAFGVLRFLGYLFGAPIDAGGLLYLGLSLAFGFVANDIRRYFLEREEYQLVGAIVGATQLECERRFFDIWPPLQNSLHKEVRTP